MSIAGLSLAWAGPAPALCGDADGDGRVLASDARAALVLAVGRGYDPSLDVGARGASDGRNTATDALGILQRAVARSLVPCAAFTSSRVAVVTASNSFGSGGVAEVRIADRTATVQSTVVAGDTVARVQGGRLFAVNRFFGNNVQELDPEAGYSTVKQCSLGAGSNPLDLLLVSATKAYVTQYERTTLAIVDPSVGPSCQGYVTGSIDLASLADADGIPEMDQIARVGDRLFVSLQRLDRANLFAPTGPGLLAVIDIATDTLVGSVELEIRNPFAETKGLTFRPHTGLLYVAGPGRLFDDLDDGGIEAVDPVTLTSRGVLIDGRELGGDLLDFVLVGDERGYALIADESFRNSLVAFDLAERVVTATLASSDELFSDIELNELGELWLSDRSFAGGAQPGLRVFSVADDSELTASPISTGLLPFNLVFLD